MHKLNTAIVLITYNRPHHTAQVLDSMRTEGVTNFVIYMDAPLNKKDHALQKELVKIYESIDWAKIKLIRRGKNTGLATSITECVSEQLKHHDSVILLEDDCCPLPGFFKFMNESLTKYRTHHKVRSVCGYQYPFVDHKSKDIHGIPLYRFNPWGWATWKDRWADYTNDARKLALEINARGLFDRLSQDLKKFCSEDYFLNGNADIWSISWSLVHYLTNSFAIFPSRTLIKNIGFDGTGVHSIQTDAFDIDDSFKDAHHPNITLSNTISFNLEVEAQIDSYLSVHSRKVMVKLTQVV
ncbi:MAG: glycosyltransferase [Elusimicrobia bacterium]|nr:glycosyltransferase [Candidatus Obscuribacterium magneticum]